MYSMPVIGEPHASHGVIGPRFSVSLASSPFWELCRRQFVPDDRAEIARLIGRRGACPGGGTRSLISVTQMTAPGPRMGRAVARYPKRWALRRATRATPPDDPRARRSSRAAPTESGSRPGPVGRARGQRQDQECEGDREQDSERRRDGRESPAVDLLALEGALRHEGMAGAGCPPPARTSGSRGSRAGTADTNASAVRGPAPRSNGPGSS